MDLSHFEVSPFFCIIVAKKKSLNTYPNKIRKINFLHPVQKITIEQLEKSP
jgi:hypothetical protein